MQGLAVKNPQPNRPRLFPFYRSDQPDELHALKELFDRVGGMSFRLDDRWTALRRAGGMVLRHGGFALTRLLPQAWKLWRRAGTLRGNYFAIVSHHFMSAAETATPEGRERLDVCAFKVSLNGKLESMCAVNALGLREEFYREGQPGAAPSPVVALA